jgi:hypothetical protein
MFTQTLAAAAASSRVGLVAAGLALTALFIPSSQAAADEWQVSKATGQVLVSSPLAQQAAVKSGMILRSGQTLQTGAGGRALLVHGNDTVSVGPNTVLSVPLFSGIGMTRLVQTAGVTELEVEKLDRPHLTVETPYLAAVVKGTHFTVTVSDGNAKVSVTRGLVQVSNLRGDSEDVAAGQQASVSEGGGVTLTGAGVGPAKPSAATPTGARSASLGDRSSASGGTGSVASNEDDARQAEGDKVVAAKVEDDKSKDGDDKSGKDKDDDKDKDDGGKGGKGKD